MRHLECHVRDPQRTGCSRRTYSSIRKTMKTRVTWWDAKRGPDLVPPAGRVPKQARNGSGCALTVVERACAFQQRSDRWHPQ
mmetsp:Transcript_39856/g.44943  ORF Transcript_39856/g.44943 Transcript_39856/m.44943 type:complete len:82 (-) Transcript_39856:500-745(-)